MILDLAMDLLLKKQFKFNSSSTLHRLTFLALVIPDLFIIVYILPFEKFDWIPGLICLRDTLFNYSFLSRLNRLDNSTFKAEYVNLVSFLIASANILSCFTVVTTDENYFRVTLGITGASVAIVLTILGLTYFRLYKKVLKFWHEKKSLDSNCIISCVYAVVYLLFFLADWLVVCIPVTAQDPNWNLVSSNYLTLYTYSMTMTTTVTTVTSIRVSAAQVSAAKAMYTRYISHEIRTPLNTVALGLKLLESEILEGDIGQSLQTVSDLMDSITVATGILNDLLTSDKVSTNTLQLDCEDLSPVPFVADTLRPMMVQARQAQLSVEIHMDESTSTLLNNCRIRADRNKLSQVLRNLFSNSMKFTPEGGSIGIHIDLCRSTDAKIVPGSQTFLPALIRRLSAVGVADYDEEHGPTYDRLKISIRDSGVGIAQENQEKLFDNVVQFEVGKLQAGGGSGLGLYISKGIVVAHNGSIYMSSAGLGTGCTFTVELPVLVDNPVRSAAQNQTPPIDNCHVSTPQRPGDGIVRSQSIRMNPNAAAVYPSMTHTSIYVDVLATPQTSVSSSPVRRISLHEHKSEGSLRAGLEGGHRGTLASTGSMSSAGGPRVSPGIESLVGITLLVVDDSQLTRKMIVRSLHARGARCVEAGDGLEAVAQMETAVARGTHIDCILMDFEMPNMNGPTATKTIRELGFKGPIFGVTGNVAESEIRTFVNAGAQLVFPKPLHFNKLCEEMRILRE